VGRDYWARSGHYWAGDDRRSQRFADIISAEYRAAVNAGPPVTVPPPATTGRSSLLTRWVGVPGRPGFASGFARGCVVGAFGVAVAAATARVALRTGRNVRPATRFVGRR